MPGSRRAGWSAVHEGRSYRLKNSRMGARDKQLQIMGDQRAVANRGDTRSRTRPELLARGSIAVPHPVADARDAPEIDIATAATADTGRSAVVASHDGHRSPRLSSERAPTPSSTREADRLTTHSIGTPTLRPVAPYDVISRRTRCEIGSRTRPSTCPSTVLPDVISAPINCSSCAAVDVNITLPDPRLPGGGAGDTTRTTFAQDEPGRPGE